MRILDRVLGLDGELDVRCRGLALSAARAYIKETFGTIGWQELLAALPDARAVATWDAIIMPAAWYAMPLLAGFLDAAQSCFGETHAVGQQLGRRIARAELQHRVFLDVSTDLRAVLHDSPRLWSAYFSDGALCITRRAGDTLELVLHNPGVPRMVCGELVVGWGSELLEAAGATVVENVHYRCARDRGATCAYRLRWR